MVTQEYLKSILHYNFETGLWTWLIDRKNGPVKAGDIAGFINNDGYVIIKINCNPYLGHRLAWLYATGKWPVNEIDHEDGVTYNNKWLNLREATHAQNSKNRKLNVNNTTGFKGVYLRGNKYRAKINFNGRQINLGTFNTADEAYDAYLQAADWYHGQFVRKGIDYGRTV